MGNEAQQPSTVNPYVNAGIQGATGLINQGLTYLREKEQRKWVEKMTNEQRQWDLNMWNATNEYNTPANQIARMENAGLNPLYFGLDGSSASGMSAASPLGMPNQGTKDIANPMESIMQAKLFNAQIENIKADTRKKNAEAGGQEYQNEIAPDLFALTKEERTANIQQTFAKIDETKANTALIRANTDLTKLKEDYQNFMNALAEIDVKHRDAILTNTEKLSEAQRLYIKAETELTELRTKYAKEDREDQKRIIKQQIEENEIQLDYMRKRKEKHQEILDAEIKTLEGNARYAKHHFGLDLAGKVATGIGALGAVGIGIAKIAGKAVVPPMIDNSSLWPDIGQGSTYSGSIIM